MSGLFDLCVEPEDSTATEAPARPLPRADGGYPMAYRGGFGGAFAPLAFEGDLTVLIDLTGVDTNTPVTLPTACDDPVSQ